MLTNILARFWISCDIYSAVKFRTVFRIAKSWTGYEDVINQSNSRIQNPCPLRFSRKKKKAISIKNKASNALKFELKEDGTKPRNKGCTGRTWYQFAKSLQTLMSIPRWKTRICGLKNQGAVNLFKFSFADLFLCSSISFKYIFCTSCYIFRIPNEFKARALNIPSDSSQTTTWLINIVMPGWIGYSL